MKTHYRFRKDLVFQRFGKKLVIFDSEQGNFYTFNETASQIISKIKQQWDLEKIAVWLRTKYQASKERILKDITTILQDLNNKQLLFESTK
jgi:hypothetical protein